VKGGRKCDRGEKYGKCVISVKMGRGVWNVGMVRRGGA